MGGPRLTTMVKGETIMPVPGGEITSTETCHETPLGEAIKTADAEPAVEEFTLDEEVVEE